MSESTRNMCREQALATRAHLEELWQRIDHGAADHGDVWDEDDARNELDEMPLEIVWEAGEPFAVVLGTGGPHVEIRGGGRHDGTGYTLHVYWGGEHVMISGESVTRTGEYFRELVESM